MVDVATARRKLLEALGDFAEKYWSNMKLWYKQKISKDDFDTQAFELLGPGKINYHNEFILAILAKCQAAAATTPSNNHSKSSANAKANKSIHLRKPRVKRSDAKTPVLVQEFVMPDAMEMAPSFISKGEDNDITLCSQDLVLPDLPTLHGRLLLGAWDVGLDSIDDQTVPLLAAAVEAHLKNILTLCVSRRKSFVIRPGSHFHYCFGAAQQRTDISGTHLHKTSKQTRTCDQAEAEAYTRLASGEVCNPVLSPISLFNLRDSIQESRQIIPSHTVRAVNMERILSELWHPGHDEIQQNELYILETRKLHEKLKQQRGLRV